jgi:hypothetical protein
MLMKISTAKPMAPFFIAGMHCLLHPNHKDILQLWEMIPGGGGVRDGCEGQY